MRGSIKQTDMEWCSWDKRDASFTVDLGAVEEFSRISMGFVTNYGMAAHKPASVRIEVSDDNENFTEIAARSYTEEEIFREGNYQEEALFETGVQRGRYVRVSLSGFGGAPKYHTRPGKEAVFYVDEIVVE